MFLALAIVTGLLAGWLHFRMDYAGHTEVDEHPAQPRAGLHPAAGGGDDHGAARGRARWPRAPCSATPPTPPPRPTSRPSPPGCADTSCAMADDVLVEPDTNAGMLQPVPGQQLRPDGPLGGDEPGRLHPERRQRHPRAVRARSTANPGTVNSDGSPNKPNVGVGYSAGTGGGYGPVGRQRVAGVPAVRPGPGAHPGDGQLRREHRWPPRPPRRGTSCRRAPRTGRW